MISGSDQNLEVVSGTPGAMVVVRDDSGNEVFRGAAPAYVTVDRGRGYFSAPSYEVTISAAEHQPQSVRLRVLTNPAYFINVITGNFAGLFFIDPATGAMFNHQPDNLNVTLRPFKTPDPYEPVGVQALPGETLPPPRAPSGPQSLNAPPPSAPFDPYAVQRASGVRDAAPRGGVNGAAPAPSAPFDPYEWQREQPEPVESDGMNFEVSTTRSWTGQTQLAIRSTTPGRPL